MNIAIVAETAPAKTLIPIIEKLDTDVNITSLTHSEGADQLLSVYSDELISIGQSRRNTQKRRSDIKIASLVMRDVYRTHRELKNRDIDLVLTCGNAGDVRKGIMAAKKLKIPTIHIEQDIYNPIEMISYADIITVPHEDAKKKLKKMYGITNTINIRGYPQAEYVSKVPLTDKKTLYDYYNIDDFYLLVLGGDAKAEDVPRIIHEVEKLDKDILIVPYRFDTDYVLKSIRRNNTYVIDGYVDLLSLMNASQGVIYIAGMGITIEAGVLSTPAVKIRGFHRDHESNNLATRIGINVVDVEDISYGVDHMKPAVGSRLVNNGIKASWKVADLIKQRHMFKMQSGGASSLKRIWNQRKKYR
ncbi:MAG: UDP-N-acetylglucosamine 2-epimerase [Methanosphaera sp.]|uniref:UDP-N-acetylglucosamine 2-epimerase n=1 Tax=Methanosphaera sp. TaxID=2666342 RepID=UPI0025DEEDF8|nr:UDP-N-acetylglucosamine 2-epimerase [Methanosphaera sp.]MCI5867599.1 UDP-N-acetylglucosamine 2-epimerase [Methanosphaera sp.]MDD6534066.1 UDP-N-acetylglucosamine 2-epimerase [Methanosphaera sp.]MDY3956124.1 UDP-N-acetylglucosamine 2-epimerase [Methanosphaera sp.]